jgi:hypothetical protein
MLPLSNGLHPRRFPIVNVALIAANFAVWILLSPVFFKESSVAAGVVVRTGNG